MTHADTLLAGIIPAPDADQPAHQVALENLRVMVERLNLDLLPPDHRVLVECCRQYADDTDWMGALTEDALMAFLRADRATPEVAARFVDLFAGAAIMAVTPAAFRFALKRHVEERRDDSYISTLTTAAAIQTEGQRVGKVMLKGHADSVQFLRERLADLDRGYNSDALPEGDVREEALQIEAEYQKRKTEPERFVGLLSGVDLIDNVTNGAQKGEFQVVGGFTEAGKTHWVIQWGLHGCCHQGKNIAFATAEVPYRQYRRRIALRHFRNAQWGTPHGIDAERFKLGRLDDREEQALHDALVDLETNPQYGRLYVFQVPLGGGFDYIESKAISLNARWQPYGGLDALIIDSLNLLETGQKIEHTRLGLNDLIKRAKQFAMGFDRGRGLAVISPWHANRKSYQEAVESGCYTLRSWSEANELEKSADLVMWLLRTPTSMENHEILAGIEKYRDGRSHLRFTLYEDFASGYIGAVSTTSTTDNQAQTGPYGLY